MKTRLDALIAILNALDDLTPDELEQVALRVTIRQFDAAMREITPQPFEAKRVP